MLGVTASVPPSVILPEVVTVPDSDKPDTVPVPDTLVTVPVVEDVPAPIAVRKVAASKAETVLSALHSMDFDAAKTMRVGRYFEMDVEAGTEGAAKDEVTQMCDRLLVNPVIEDYTFDLKEC